MPPYTRQQARRERHNSLAPFLNLPLELRWNIYRQYLLESRYYESRRAHYINHSLEEPSLHVVSESEHLVDDDRFSLFQVCKQIYNELIPVYYEVVSLSFINMTTFRAVTSNSMVFRQRIRHLVLDIHETVPLHTLRRLPALRILEFRDDRYRRLDATAWTPTTEQTAMRSVIEYHFTYPYGGKPFLYQDLRSLHQAMNNDATLCERGVQMRVRFNILFSLNRVQGRCRQSLKSVWTEYRFQDNTYVIVKSTVTRSYCPIHDREGLLIY